MIPEDTPSVVKHGSHTAICLGKKRTYWWLIPMSNKMLRVMKLTDKQMVSEKWEPMAYAVERVAQQYLKHGAGIGPVAEKFLNELLNKPKQLDLEFDCDLIGELT